MLRSLHVLGNYWRDDADELTPLGGLMAAAKDRGDEAALAALRRFVVEQVAGLVLPDDPLVIAVPPGPGRDAHPVPALAAAVADALAVPVAATVTRHHDTVRLRDAPADRRRALVEAAGYTVEGDVEGRSVILVDDVILTGTTLGYLDELLRAAGAGDVVAVVVCRTRLAASP